MRFRKAAGVGIALRVSRRILTAEFRGDLEGALADYNQAIKLDPRFADAWFNRATSWKAKGDLRGSEADFTVAIELKSHLADAYAQRGLVRLLNGKGSEAEQDFARCLALDKNLKQQLEQLITEAKQQLAARGQIR